MKPDGDTPQKRGRNWEPLFAKSIGAKPVKMSGAGFAKLDVRGSQILWSLKYTESGSIRMSNALMEEAKDAINGPGGIGGSNIPAIALNIDGEEYVVFRKADAMLLMTSDDFSIAAPKPSRYQSSRTRVPEHLRPIEDDEE